MTISNKTVSKTIGILGADTGCGTTHLALSLANCSVSRLRKKTALIGIDSHALCNMITDDFEYQEGIYHFQINGIDIFAPVSSNDIAKILNMSFDNVIIDFGHLKKESHEFERCQKQIITASFSPFRRKNLDLIIGDACEFSQLLRAEMVVYGKNEYSVHWERKHRKSIFYSPFIANPLNIPIKDANRLISLLN